MGRLVVIGANHRTSSEATRDRLLIPEDAQPDFLRAAAGIGLGEAVVLSTCARTELIGIAADPEATRSGAVRLLAGLGGLDPESFGEEVYGLADEEALRHLFRVASSLDSPVVGEPEVTGQFRDSVRVAQASGHVGSRLDAVLRAASETAKRVRSETPIGERPVSMAACAAQVARDVHGDLSRVRALLIVGGEMGELIADQLRSAGLGRLTVAARSTARAEIAARRYGCHHAPLDDVPGLLPQMDLVVSALCAGAYRFVPEKVEAALSARRRRPMLFVDAAIPCDVDPGVNDLDGAFVYSLDDLERLALEGRSRRDEAAAEAEAVIDEEVRRFLRAYAERGAVPAVVALREHFERVRDEVARDVGRGDPAAEEALRRLVARLLHGPSEALRALSADSPAEAARAEELIRRLFAGGTGRGPSGNEESEK